MGRNRLNLPAVEQSLRTVQREFPKVNEVLRSRRDSMTDAVVENMMAGYAFVDWAMADDTDLLDPRYVAGLLELNHIVLCGRDPNSRQEHRKHFQATAQRFYTQEEFNILKRINPDLNLPKSDIAVVVRQDGSGTTYAFTNHLSAISDEWRDRGPGVGTLIDWPGNAMAARGNEGVAGRIKISKGSIGYVEYGMARRSGLAMAWLENKAGQVIEPHGGSGLATLLNTPLPENLRVFFPDPDGQDSYHIVTDSWLLLYKQYDDAQRLTALR
jgi:hypothetical protein